MKTHPLPVIFGLFFLSIYFLAFTNPKNGWLEIKEPGLTLYYKSSDQPQIKSYDELLQSGVKATEHFFNSKFKSTFTVYVHPNRNSLDSAWQTDWKMPNFKSECWMVASGTGTQLNIISPVTWDKSSCEHSYSDKIATRKLLTHELVHVFHGQHNSTPDFSDAVGIDWFVEGLAVYASGQCDSSRIAAVKISIRDHHEPDSLDQFWTGKLKYGRSGSMVMYLDSKYGRDKIISLLPLSKKSEILEALNVSEGELIENWKSFMLK